LPFLQLSRNRQECRSIERFSCIWSEWHHTGPLLELSCFFIMPWYSSSYCSL